MKRKVDLYWAIYKKTNKTNQKNGQILGTAVVPRGQKPPPVEWVVEDIWLEEYGRRDVFKNTHLLHVNHDREVDTPLDYDELIAGEFRCDNCAMEVYRGAGGGGLMLTSEPPGECCPYCHGTTFKIGQELAEKERRKILRLMFSPPLKSQPFAILAQKLKK